MVSIADPIFFYRGNKSFENPIGPPSNNCCTVAIESFSFCDQNHLRSSGFQRLSKSLLRIVIIILMSLYTLKTIRSYWVWGRAAQNPYEFIEILIMLLRTPVSSQGC